MCNVSYQSKTRCYHNHQKIREIINGRYRAFKTGQTLHPVTEIPCYLSTELIPSDIGWHVYEGPIPFSGTWVGSSDLSLGRSVRLCGCRIKNRGRWLGKFYIPKHYFELFETYLFNRALTTNCLTFNTLKSLSLTNLYSTSCWSVSKSASSSFGRPCIRKQSFIISRGNTRWRWCFLTRDTSRGLRWRLSKKD